MKKILKDEQGQTIIEYALVLSFFVLAFTIAMPPLRTATVAAFSRMADQLNMEIQDAFILPPGWNEGEDTSSGSNEPWFPPELNLYDENVIYSAENVTLTGSSKIFGNVVTNGSLVASGSSYVDGTVWENANHEWNFPMPVFPSISSDDLPNQGSLRLSGGAGVHTISESGYYSSIELLSNKSITIDTGNEGDVLTLLVDNLDVAQGHINLVGDGKLILKVNNTFSFGGSSTLNSSGLSKNVIMYYSGQDSLEFFGNTHYNGSIYTQTSGARFGGSTTIVGSVMVAGEQVYVSDGGTANLNDALLYAPNADLRLVGNASIEGRIIANSITGIGNSTIKFKPIDISDDFYWEIEG